MELDPDNADIYHHRGQVGRVHQEFPYCLSNSFYEISATGAPAYRPDQCSHCRLQQGSGPPAQFPSCLCSKAVHRLQVETIAGLPDGLLMVNRAANTIGDTVTVNKVLEQFNEAVEKFPKYVG